MSDYYDKYIKYKIKNGGAAFSLLKFVVPYIKTAASTLFKAATIADGIEFATDISKPDMKEKINNSRKKSLYFIEQVKQEVSDPSKKIELEKVLNKDYDRLIEVLNNLIKYLNNESLDEPEKHRHEIINLFSELNILIRRIPNGVLSFNIQQINDTIVWIN